MSAHIKFQVYLKQHIKEVTVSSYVKRLKIISKITDLDNTKNAKNAIYS